MEIPRHEPLVWYAPGVEAHLLALGLEDLCALAGDLSEPRLAALGVTESDIGSMLVDAPRRLLTGA